MIADCDFLQGSTHRVCEDYILSGEDYVVGADGSSGAPMPGSDYTSSSDERLNTDIGARLICISAQNIMKNRRNINNPNHFGIMVIQSAAQMCNALNINKSCLLSTLVMCVKNDKNFDFYMYGDGFFVINFKDGTKHVVTAKFKSGAPYYLVYDLKDETKKRFIEECGDRAEITTYNLTENSMDIIDQYEKYVTFDEPFCLRHTVKEDAVRQGIIFSDGPDAFIDQNQVKVPTEHVLWELSNLKSINGSFVQRRLQKAKKTFKAKSWTPTDDLLMGAVV